MSFGRRNWMFLNRDVAMVQKNLHGKLPSRENVTELLQRVVVESPLNTNTLRSVAGTDRATDDRMSSQKRLLSDEYGINFPTNKTKRKKTGHSLSTATSRAVARTLMGGGVYIHMFGLCPTNFF